MTATNEMVNGSIVLIAISPSLLVNGLNQMIQIPIIFSFGHAHPLIFYIYDKSKEHRLLKFHFHDESTHPINRRQWKNQTRRRCQDG